MFFYFVLSSLVLMKNELRKVFKSPRIKRFMEGMDSTISLVGFESLSQDELEIAQKIVKSRLHELMEKTDYKSLKMHLRRHDKGKSIMYEIEAKAQVGNDMLGASVEDWELSTCLSEIFDKIIAEALHRKRTGKERNKELIRRFKKLKI